jgi:hypothetical protein
MTLAFLPLLFFQASSLYNIAGAVVDGQTNAPLNRTTVSIQNVTGEPARSVITGSDGQFRFEGVHKGKYSLTAEHNSIQQAYMQHALYQPYASAIATGDNEQTENIVFRFIPGSAITGYVKDLHGEPVRGILVRAYRIVGPNKQAQTAGTGSTNDLGYYRIHALAAGTYILVLNARAWKYEAAEEANPSAFPVTFFPGVTDPARAGTIHVDAGEEARADVSIDPAPSARVKGVVAASANLKGSLTVTLAAKGPFGTRFAVADAVGVYDNQFNIDNVPAGRYELSLLEDQTHLRAVRSIDVMNRDEQYTIGDVPLPQLVVLVQARGAPKPAAPTLVALTDIDSGATVSIAVPPNGNLFLPEVPPGRYRIAAAQKSLLPILSVKARGAVADGDRIEIPEAGKVELSLIVDAAAGDLNGRVVRGKRGEAGALVMLVPRTGWENRAAYRFDQSDSDGTFTWQGVAKGDYLMFAFESGEPEDYTDPEALRELLPTGKPITVTGAADQTAILELAGEPSR